MKSCAAGFTEWLLFHIWKKTDSPCPSLPVPDTVIYRLGKPFFWYFTDPCGQVLRKSKSKVSHKFIFEEFQETPNDILAYYLGFDTMTKAKANSATIEFFTQDSFADFIHNRDKCNSGILQRWTQPKSLQNSVIKVQWSQQFCLIERRTNKNKLDDSKIGFYEKLTTYEGMEHNSISEPITAPWIIAELQKICVQIASHIAIVTGGNVTITRMVLFFKQDKEDKLWFLYCSALKLLDLSVSEFDQPIEWKELEVSVPKHILLEKLPLGSKGVEAKKNRTFCPGCNYLTRDNLMYDIALSAVVKFFATGRPLPKQGQSVRENSKDNDQPTNKVPKVVLRINKNMNNEKYEEMKNDPTWEHLQIKVCQDCFLHFTEVYSVPKQQPCKPIIVLEELKRQTPLSDPKKTESEASLAGERRKELPPIKPVASFSKPYPKPKLISSVSTKNIGRIKLRSLSKPKLEKSAEKLPENDQEKSSKAEVKSINNVLQSASKVAMTIYNKVAISSKKQHSTLSTNHSRHVLDSGKSSDFLQETLSLLKDSISRLENPNIT